MTLDKLLSSLWARNRSFFLTVTQQSLRPFLGPFFKLTNEAAPDIEWCSGKCLGQAYNLNGVYAMMRVIALIQGSMQYEG